MDLEIDFAGAALPARVKQHFHAFHRVDHGDFREVTVIAGHDADAAEIQIKDGKIFTGLDVGVDQLLWLGDVGFVIAADLTPLPVEENRAVIQAIRAQLADGEDQVHAIVGGQLREAFG